MPGAEIAIAHSTPWYVAAGVGILLLPVMFFTVWKFIWKARIEINTADLSLQQHSIFKASIDDLSQRLDDARKDRANTEEQYRQILKALSDVAAENSSLKQQLSDQDNQMRVQAQALVNLTRELTEARVELTEAKMTIKELSGQIEALGGGIHGPA